MTNALILDLEARLGPMLAEIAAGVVDALSLVADAGAAIARLKTGCYDLVVLVGMDGDAALALVEAIEEHAPGLPILFVRAAAVADLPVKAGAFTAVLDEPFSPRRFRDVLVAIAAAPEMVRRRLSRRREVSLAAELVPGSASGHAEGEPLGRACTVANLSRGGLMISIHTVDLNRLGLAGGASVELRCHDPRLELVCPARITYVERMADGCSRVGLELGELAPASASRLESFLAIVGAP